MALTAKIGENVEILTSEGKTDPNIYKVEEIQKQLVVLRCQETGQPHKVHKSRISKVIKENIDMDETVMSTATTTQAEEIASEVSAALTPTSTDSKIDFDQLVEDGFEVWTKKNLNFDQGGYEVEAHCVINPDQTGYETFNTYNGSRGKNNSKMKKGEPKKRSVYTIKDDKALEKKRKILERKGYTKRVKQ